MEQVIDKLLEKCFSFMDEIVELSTIVEGLRKENYQIKEENKKLREELMKKAFKTAVQPDLNLRGELLNDKK